MRQLAPGSQGVGLSPRDRTFDWAERELGVSITKAQVRNSPDIEVLLYALWTPGLSGTDGLPGSDPHLRSCREVTNYQVRADDGDIGHVDGILVDDQTWAIRYLVVNTSNWWLGHRVLIAPSWVKKVDWLCSEVSIHLSRDEIRRVPAYDAAMTVSRSQDADIYRHYNRPGYWIDQREQELREPG